MRAGFPCVLATLLASLAVVDETWAAGLDGRVEWSGISHVPWQDRRPLCPVAGEAFEVHVQALRGDLSAVRVKATGVAAEAVWIDAVRSGTRGSYERWVARIPAATGTVVRYWIAVTDGADTDYYSAGGMTDELPANGGFELDFATLSHAPMGATLTTGGAVFRVWARAAQRAAVPGEWNGWDPAGSPMRKVGEHFIVQIPGVRAGHQYKFRFDGVLWNSDPRARRLNPGEHFNGFVEDPFAYSWGDAGFRAPELAEMVIYQLHVGTFAGQAEADPARYVPARYVDVAARVEHLRELGINAVLLNPITEFSGRLSGGYNPVSQWAAASAYGTPDELKHLIDVLHQSGIAVLFDIVWNHVSPTDTFWWQYDGAQQYFDTPAVLTPWGAQADFDEPAVQDYFLDSALLWLEEYHADGFRMDATKYMYQKPHGASGWRLMQRFNDMIDRRYAGAVTIAEEIPGNPALTRPTRLGGGGFDVQYRRELRDVLYRAVVDAAAGKQAPSVASVRRMIEGGDMPGRLGLSYFQLHDEAWPANGGKRAVVVLDPEGPHDDARARSLTTLAQGLVMLAPGVPAMLMGDEWLEDRDFGPEHPIDWSKKHRYAGTVAYYRDLITLRRSRPALRADAPVQVLDANEQRGILVFRRYHKDGEVLVIANLGQDDHAGYRVGLPGRGGWREVLSNQSAASGSEELRNADVEELRNADVVWADDVPVGEFAQSAVFAVPRWGLVVFEPVHGAGSADGIRPDRMQACLPELGSRALCELVAWILRRLIALQEYVYAW